MVKDLIEKILSTAMEKEESTMLCKNAMCSIGTTTLIIIIVNIPFS